MRRILLTLFFLAFNVHATEEVPTLSTQQLMDHNPQLRLFFKHIYDQSQTLQGKRVALLTTDGVEEIELTAQIDFLRARGANVKVLAPKFPKLDPKWGVHFPKKRKDHILTVRFMENGPWVKVDGFIENAQPEDFDAAIIPGGAWNPDTLRIHEPTLKFVRAIFDSGKLTAAICHGPVVFINAKILSQKRATATWNVHIDLKNSGALVLDEPVVIDQNLITSRHPIDLPPFLNAIEKALKD